MQWLWRIEFWCSLKQAWPISLLTGLLNWQNIASYWQGVFSDGQLSRFIVKLISIQIFSKCLASNPTWSIFRYNSWTLLEFEYILLMAGLRAFENLAKSELALCEFILQYIHLFQPFPIAALLNSHLWQSIDGQLQFLWPFVNGLILGQYNDRHSKTGNIFPKTAIWGHSEDRQVVFLASVASVPMASSNTKGSDEEIFSRSSGRCIDASISPFKFDQMCNFLMSPTNMTYG